MLSIQEAITNGESEHFMSRVENLLPSLVKNLEAPTSVKGHATERKFEKIVHVLDVFAGEWNLHIQYMP